MMIRERVSKHREEILRLAEKWGATNVRIFGSVARGQAQENSDVDILVSFKAGSSLFDECGLHLDLEDLLHCEVDLVGDDAISPYLKDTILSEAKPL